MTEPTAEQVERERERAHELNTFLCYTDIHAVACTRIAAALARVRKEGHAAGRDEGLDAAAHLSETLDEMVHMHDLPDAIRALRGRT